MKSQFRVTIESERREEDVTKAKTCLEILWPDDFQPCSFCFYFLRFGLTTALFLGYRSIGGR